MENSHGISSSLYINPKLCVFCRCRLLIPPFSIFHVIFLWNLDFSFACVISYWRQTLYLEWTKKMSILYRIVISWQIFLLWLLIKNQVRKIEAKTDTTKSSELQWIVCCSYACKKFLLAYECILIISFCSWLRQDCSTNQATVQDVLLWSTRRWWWWRKRESWWW